MCNVKLEGATSIGTKFWAHCRNQEPDHTIHLFKIHMIDQTRVDIGVHDSDYVPWDHIQSLVEKQDEWDKEIHSYHQQGGPLGASSESED